MPSLGSVYIRDASGHTAALDSSGFLYVNVNGTLSVGNVNVSGQAVATSGQIIGLTPNNYSGMAATLSGLQVVATTQVTTNISGQVVYLTSGTNSIQIQSGFNQVSISGDKAAFSGLVVGVSGQTVTVISGIVPNISGQAINVSGSTVTVASGLWLASGINVLISGQPVTTSVSIGAVAVSSGEVHVMSGVFTVGSGITATLSGLQVVVSGVNATSISGNVVAIQSGNLGAPVGVIGSSGAGATLSGITVLASITTNISGNVVYLTSGFNLIQIASGFNQVTVSGFASMSGLPLGVSGQTITVASGSIVLNSGQTVTPSSGAWLASGIVLQISGQIAGISGQSVKPWLGAPTMASGFGFSGLAIPVVGAMYDASGANWVPLSANISGSNNSLQVAEAPATKIVIGFSGTVVQSGMTSNSGGDPLTGKSGSPLSISTFEVTVRNLSGNNTVYVGGSGARPFSGFGFPLYAGDGLTQSITDASLIYVYASTSGQYISWVGSQF